MGSRLDGNNFLIMVKLNNFRGMTIMKIAAIYTDGVPGFINADDLDWLLQKRAISLFRRSEGWVRVGFDVLRGSGNSNKYYGRDRRKTDKLT